MKLIEYLKTNNYDKIYYPTDVRRIVNVMKDKDVEVMPNEAEELWYEYSNDLDTYWVELPMNDNEIFETIIYYAKRKYKVGWEDEN